VMSQGRLVGHFAAAQADARQLGLYMTGVRRDPQARAALDAPFTAVTPSTLDEDLLP